MPYCLYLRKSRADLDAEARGEGETLARHEKTLLELSMRQHFEIREIYREIVSGETIAARPVMQRLLSEVEHGIWDGVLVMEVERLARGDTIDQGIVAQTFKFSGTKIITPMKIYDPDNEYDEEYFEFGLFMSRREYKTINRRLQRGRVASVMEGKYNGSRPPYGYRRVKIENDRGYTLQPDEEQAPIVELIFSLYAFGEKTADGGTEETGISKIARKLNNLKIPSAKGGDWTAASLQTMLRNPVYIGKIRWNARPIRKKMEDGQMVKTRPRAKPEDWILKDGLHPALIDEKTWEAVQLRLRENPSRPCPQKYETQNSLAGLVVCGICGRKMVRRPQKGKESATLMCPAPTCRNISCRLDCAEERILLALRDWLSDYRLTYEAHPPHAPQSGFKKKALAKMICKRKELEKQRERIYEFFEKGVYTASIFQERLKKMQEQMDCTEKGISQIQIEMEGAKSESSKAELPRAEPVLARYRSGTPAEKNALLKSVLKKVVYTKTVRARRNGPPDGFELILFPRLRQSHADD